MGNSMKKLIILRGYPGSGKTTIGKRLEACGVGTFIDHNAILTFIAGIAGDDDGIYEQIAALELALCEKLLQKEQAVIVARGFSALSSLAPYEEAARKLDVECRIIRLDVSGEALGRRVASPERRHDFNPTVTEDALQQWVQENQIENHDDETIVDNEKPIEEVVEAIVEML